MSTDGSMIENCTYAGSINAAAVTGTNQVAGIVARVTAGLSVSGCVNHADISTACSRVGGIVGMLHASGKTLELTKCVNYGNITSTSTADGVGGIIGRLNQGSATFEQCANYGNVTGASFAAGILGSNKNGGTAKSFLSCANYGNINGQGASGFIQNAYGITFKNSYSTGNLTNISGASALIVGWASDTSVVENCTGNGSAELYTGPCTVTNTEKCDVVADAVKILNTGLEPPVWVAGKTVPELKWIADMNATPAPEITIDGASLTIGGNVTMNLFVKKTTVTAAGVTTLKTISIVDDDGNAYEKAPEENDDYYVFTISGIKASEFGKNKIYHVQYTTADAPETAIDCTATKEYSPLQYAINMYNSDDDVTTVTDLDKLLLSIVNYADAAAKTTVASTAFKAAHANADFTTLPKFADIIAKDTGVYTYDKLKDAKNLPDISMSLTETIALTLTFDGSDLYQTGNDNMMMIGNAEIPGEVNVFSVVFSELFATDLYNTITFTFVETYESGLPVPATTSLVQLLKSYKENPTYAALAEATAQYLYVARLFCLNNQTNA